MVNSNGELLHMTNTIKTVKNISIKLSFAQSLETCSSKRVHQVSVYYDFKKYFLFKVSFKLAILI